ncbi:sensor histidine kinase [Roseateles microcysteis]|uniref:sensor histidine kinase n=1 Tax=Roseateles microcysteis TaxID=3119057 RepID=UPI002FE5287F
MNATLSGKPPASLARQLSLQISLLVVLMVGALAAIAFWSVQREIAAVVPGTMLSTVQLQAAQQGQSFQLADASVRRLAREWLQRSGKLGEAEAERRFGELFERSADGVWRLRPALVDTERAPTFYLQGSKPLDADVRRRAVLGYELLREQGPALVPPFFSAYTDFVEKGLMVYSRGIDWGKGATPATDNFNYPTMTGADPRNNPKREVFWTPVYFDEEAKAWMVSVIQPLDLQGRWVGTVGHDITIDTLLQQIGQADAELGALTMIISRDGQLIAHPELRERIAKAQGQLALATLGDPVLSAVHALIASGGDTAQAARTPDGRHLVAWSRIAGPDWWAVRVAPQARIDELLHRGVLWMLAVGLVMLLLTLLLLHRVIRQRVKQPLSDITSSVEALAARVHHGEEPQTLPAQGSADLQRLSQAFDAMAQDLASHRRQEQAAQAALQSEVHERRQAEEAVHRLNLSLEARVRERGEALQQAQQELVQRETLASLGSLVAGVSHELNTPIGNALMATDTAVTALADLEGMLAGGVVRRSELSRGMQLARECVGLALANLKRSASLVQDFKQVAVDRASLQRRAFNLRRVSEEVVHLLQVSLKSPGCTVEMDLPIELVLDSFPGAFGQVLTNLVENAVVHAFNGRSDGRILISLVRSDEREVVLTVSDNGCGIAPEHQGEVFKPFFTTRLGQGGSGLGLHLVYSIVCNVLGGEIELDSEPGEGTRFTLTLPRRAPD